jgi:hypothetical protein
LIVFEHEPDVNHASSSLTNDDTDDETDSKTDWPGPFHSTINIRLALQTGMSSIRLPKQRP